MGNYDKSHKQVKSRWKVVILGVCFLQLGTIQNPLGKGGRESIRPLLVIFLIVGNLM
jgi:hypothetical protein